MYNYNEVFAATLEYFNNDELATKVWIDKYALRDNQENLLEKTPDDMHRRLAKEFARIETSKFKTPLSEEEIYELFKKFKYIIPQGSPMYGIGNDYKIISLSNCYVLDIPLDSYNSIIEVDRQLVNISKRRGGVGIDLSNLRPKNAPTNNAARSSSGLVSWMERYSNSIREVAQCIAIDQKVLTKTGLKPIQNINIGEEVWTQNAWNKVINIHKNGKKAVSKLTTKNGYTITCTLQHKFLNEKLELQKLSDFEIGDQIVMIPGSKIDKELTRLSDISYDKKQYNNSNRLHQHITLPNELSSNLAYFLGYTYGDGHIIYDKFNEGYALSLACSNDYPEIKTKLQSIIKDIFNYDVCINAGDGNLETLDIFSKEICHFLKTNNLLKQKSNNLILPQLIKDTSSEVQLAFISGFFDADGNATQPTKNGLRFSSINKEFLFNIQQLLMANGILSHLVNETCSSRSSEWNDIYRLIISGKYFQNLTKNLLCDSIKITQSGQLSVRDSNKTPFKSKDFNISHNKYNYINEQLLSANAFQKLKSDENSITSEIMILDQIIDIVDAGTQETYDLTVENTHMFYCEGFYVKNSGRRGALMLTVSIHHPDIMEFCTVKNDPTKVTGANISVRLTKEFLDAVKNETDYELRWPLENPQITKMVSAKEVWKLIIHSAWLRAEPGLLMWNNIVENTPTDCYEEYQSVSANPCSEINLSPLDSCRLMCLNLLSYVNNPFTKEAYFDNSLFYKHTQLAQRLMDDLVDLEAEKIEKILQKIDSDPEPDYIKASEKEMWQRILKNNNEGRRTGTGITALGDTLAALNIKYGSEESIEITNEIYKLLKFGCYRSSIDIAKELGSFKVWDHEKEKDCPFFTRWKTESVVVPLIGTLSGTDLYKDMKKYGRRNIALLTTAPTGTVSILTQTSSGIEPVFMLSYTRRKKINPNDISAKVDFTDNNGDKWQEFTVYHPRVKQWMTQTGKTDIKESPWFEACAEDIDWYNRVKLQAAAQKHVCHAISSTINLPENVTEEEVGKIYETAFEYGCKGITVYRNNCRSGVLVSTTQIEKRPKELPCDVHHLTVKGKSYLVLVGLVNEKPYEIFSAKNGTSDKTVKKGTIVKCKKHYKAILEDETELSPIMATASDEEETVTRLVSSLLREEVALDEIVKQLDKVHGDLTIFAKSISRTLKKYIKAGTKTGSKCPECGGDLVYQSSCVSCSCGWTKCS